jgi:hypothetical protein
MKSKKDEEDEKEKEKTTVIKKSEGMLFYQKNFLMEYVLKNKQILF